jgi:hypothetical protein
MDTPAGRLATIATCAALLAGVSLARVVAQVSRAMTSVQDMDAFSGWQQPFVDGASSDVAYVGIASVVLLLMLPVSRTLRRIRRVTIVILGTAAFANLVLSLGYAFVSGTFDAHAQTMWGRPTLATIVIDQMPSWALALVVAVLLVNGAAWGPDAPMEPADDAPVGPVAVGEYLSE